MDAPVLAGVHHLKLPVRDLARSRAWYESRLGYRLRVEFVEDGELRGIAMYHPAGGPDLGLRLNPELAAAAAGFDYFSIGVPGEAEIRALAQRLTDLGEQHAGVHWATIGWILPELHDPDGHEVRFYTLASHPGQGVPVDGTVHNARERAEALESQYQAEQQDAPA
jgi:catechol 2,3-dioxygenase-like lactoylglutathione lyase family enzyme